MGFSEIQHGLPAVIHLELDRFRLAGEFAQENLTDFPRIAVVELLGVGIVGLLVFREDNAISSGKRSFLLILALNHDFLLWQSSRLLELGSHRQIDALNVVIGGGQNDFVFGWAGRS